MRNHRRSVVAEENAVRKVSEHYSLKEIDVHDIIRLMDEPVRSISTCISKGQLTTLCKQLLLQNLVMQKQIENAYDYLEVKK